ncbi:MAG: diadenylate cyclase, partial [Victivallales bacterium]|nr:diadenylate cyclase [Victivallales bacterium]
MHWDWNIAWLTFRFLVKMAVQVGVLATLLYWVMRLLKGTIVPTILYVMLTLLSCLYALAKGFKLEALQFLLERLFEYLPIFIVILMGNEIRKLLGMFSKLITEKFVPRKKSSWYDDVTISALCTEVVKMSLSKTGALIAIEQKMPLNTYMKNAKEIDATLMPGNSLLESIFFKGAPLHDGG